MELWPLRELRRLSTEPPAFSLGFSRESVSGWEDWGEPGAASGLDWRSGIGGGWRVGGQTGGERVGRKVGVKI
jgi:hypothetical protein